LHLRHKPGFRQYLKWFMSVLGLVADFKVKNDVAWPSIASGKGPNTASTVVAGSGTIEIDKFLSLNILS